MKLQTKQILGRILEIQKELDVRKALYDEYDMLTVQLQAEGFEHAEFDGFVMDLVDNFTKSNTVFRVAGVKRFEMKIKAAK